MATDKSLATLLRALQAPSQETNISRLLESATNLLALLSNPSNVSLLTSQILLAPAIWGSAIYMEAVIQVIDVFTLASIHHTGSRVNLQTPANSNVHNILTTAEWTAAVVKGAGNGIPRSKQILALTGLLRGYGSHGQRGISRGPSVQLQDTYIKAINLSLRDDSAGGPFADPSLIVAIGLVFDILDEQAKGLLHHELLLPKLISSAFLSDNGLRQGYFLSAIDADVNEGAGKKFIWSTKSQSYRQVQTLASSPLVNYLGRLSRLGAFSIGQVKDMSILTLLLQDLFDFSRSLSIQWRQNKLSEIDASEENVFLSEETIRTPLPLLWRILRTSMFAIIVLLTACTGRLLSDNTKHTYDAPSSAVLLLKILRHISFISSRMATDTLSQHMFVYLAAIDIVSQYPKRADELMHEIQPTETGTIPQHPLDRSMDLYYLNLADAFVPILDTTATVDLIMAVASSYLGVNGDSRLLQLFEAAHSVMLAVLAAPHNSDLALTQIEPYTNLLFQAFPRLISPRQFRFAIKHLARIASPPSHLTMHQPLLSSSLLEVLHVHLENASSEPLPKGPLVEEHGGDEHLSEQAVLVLALIDSLSVLPLDVLEDWLPIAVESIHEIQEPALHQTAMKRFWDVLSNGEMDVDRAAFCVAWWETRGGRVKLLSSSNGANLTPLMSGALNERSKL